MKERPILFSPKRSQEWGLILLSILIAGMLVAAMVSAYSKWSAP